MLWLPPLSVDIVSAAEPPETVTAPITEEPSRNWTDPVAAAGDSVAVNVTACPATDGFRDETTVALGFALPTVTTTTADVLPVSFASPL